MSFPVLPRELIDMVIDYLHHDQPTLMACCLVCKAWIPSSRYHLLSDIRLDYLTADRILCAPQLPSVAGFIRRLMICDMYPLPPGIEVFSSITSLYIYGCLPYAQMRVILLSMFPMLTYLELHGLKFKSFGEMVEFFCSFPRIKTLTLSCTWENDKDSSLHAYPSSTIRTLNIRAGSHALLPWLTHSMPPQLSTLRIFRLSAKHVLPLQAALKALGGSLHRLELGLCSWMEADSFVGKINLHHNLALRYFMLHNASSTLFQSVLQVLIRDTSVTEAHLISSYGGKIPRPDLPPWSVLDHSIANPAINHHLSHVIVRLDVMRHDLRDRIINEVRSWLPLCAASGILQFRSEKKTVASMREWLTGPISSRSWGDTLVY